MLPAGLLTEKYEQDKAIVRTKFQWGIFLVFLVFLVALPFILPQSWLSPLCLFFVMLVSALGLQIVVGYCGQINLGQSSFMGVGGILGCLAATKYNVPFELSLLIGGFASMIYGLIFALPAVRVKGFYLALTTLAAQFVFDFIFVRIPPEFFEGLYGGLYVEPISLLNTFPITSPTGIYFVMLAVAMLFTFFAVNISRSRLGKAFMAVRDNDIAASVMGVNIIYYKFVAFAISAFFAGVSGVLMGFLTGFTNVEQFDLFLSIWLLSMLIIGGMGSVLGAILGTAVLRLLQEIINATGPMLSELLPALGSAVIYPSMNLMIGLVVVLVLVFEPRGLAHRWRLFQRFYRLWPFPY